MTRERTDPVASSCTVHLTGMEFHAYHGVHEYELERGARFVVDVALSVPEPTRDALGATVDYSRVYRLVSERVMGRRFRLIESLAAHLADAVLESEPGVLAVSVRVHKPHAPLTGIVRDVSCEVHRTRRQQP